MSSTYGERKKIQPVKELVNNKNKSNREEDAHRYNDFRLHRVPSICS